MNIELLSSSSLLGLQATPDSLDAEGLTATQAMNEIEPLLRSQHPQVCIGGLTRIPGLLQTYRKDPLAVSLAFHRLSVMFATADNRLRYQIVVVTRRCAEHVVRFQAPRNAIKTLLDALSATADDLAQALALQILAVWAPAVVEDKGIQHALFVPRVQHLLSIQHRDCPAAVRLLALVDVNEEACELAILVLASLLKPENATPRRLGLVMAAAYSLPRLIRVRGNLSEHEAQVILKAANAEIRPQARHALISAYRCLLQNGSHIPVASEEKHLAEMGRERDEASIVSLDILCSTSKAPSVVEFCASRVLERVSARITAKPASATEIIELFRFVQKHASNLPDHRLSLVRACIARSSQITGPNQLKAIDVLFHFGGAGTEVRRMIRGIEGDSSDLNVAWIRYRVGIRSLCRGAPHMAYEQIQKLSALVSIN
ncbi:hypothetical protein BJ684DRAFT_19874 [Piptocephalis cylindrospora]|uniref:Uncharacterized protein n=1 Tax=Piptocephalis cylindrospora TaxID=1907219 RepID=A0A4P9Y3W5_9FUNG|nr:hypothetical protein BJ684DRAFT_19874 [Piptocephalis cylindrospora]|eukprot:RKP13658.1 hypothetical protein BJ684DRAFT_19874 [Piptocephalis cylindrospora]